MIVADVLKILFIVLGVLITLVCYWLLFEACLPGFVQRAQRGFERRPGKSFLWGLLCAGPVLAVGLLLLSAGVGPVKLAGMIVLLALLLVALMGSAGFAGLVGQRLSSPLDQAQPWRRVLRGGIVVSITFVLPLLGWFVLLPGVLVAGVGAALQARKPEAAAVLPVTAEPAPL